MRQTRRFSAATAITHFTIAKRDFSSVSWKQKVCSVAYTQADHSPDNVKFPDGSRQSAC